MSQHHAENQPFDASFFEGAAPNARLLSKYEDITLSPAERWDDPELSDKAPQDYFLAPPCVCDSGDADHESTPSFAFSSDCSFISSELL